MFLAPNGDNCTIQGTFSEIRLSHYPPSEPHNLAIVTVCIYICHLILDSKIAIPKIEAAE